MVDRSHLFTGPMTVKDGELRIASTDALAASQVVPAAGTRVTVSAGLRTTVGGLAPLAGGVIDIGNGSITVAADLTKDDLLKAIRAGRGDGFWNGTSGITSSEAAASGGSRTVGWLEHGDGSITFAYAAAGDTNLDWSIDIIDIMNIVAGGRFNSGLPATWRDGDFNDDGLVDGLDFVALVATGLYARGDYNVPAAAVTAAAVPEPSSAWVAGLVALAAGLRLAGGSNL